MCPKSKWCECSYSLFDLNLFRAPPCCLRCWTLLLTSWRSFPLVQVPFCRWFHVQLHTPHSHQLLPGTRWSAPAPAGAHTASSSASRTKSRRSIDYSLWSDSAETPYWSWDSLSGHRWFAHAQKCQPEAYAPILSMASGSDHQLDSSFSKQDSVGWWWRTSSTSPTSLSSPRLLDPCSWRSTGS